MFRGFVRDIRPVQGLIGELSWRPSRSSGEWLLYQTWEHAETKADNMSSAPAPKNGTWDNGALETVQLKDSLIMSSALLINLQASLLNSHMGHEQMAALAGTMAGFAAEQAAASELGYTTASPHERLPQISLLLQCAMHSDVSGKTAGLGSDAWVPSHLVLQGCSLLLRPMAAFSLSEQYTTRSSTKSI